jgi:glycerophosphoryl diester phosphodiesterase
VILLDPTARPVVAHRGDSAHAPENTMLAFERAVRLGADALEFDVRLSADGVAVVHHDPTLDRTTDGGGPVGALPLAGLRAVDAGARFTADGGRTYPFRGGGVRVPTLDEVLGAWPRVPVLIEIKVAAASAEVRRVLDRHAAAGRAVVASFLDAAVAPFRGLAVRHGRGPGRRGAAARGLARGGAGAPGVPARVGAAVLQRAAASAGPVRPRAPAGGGAGARLDGRPARRGAGAVGGGGGRDGQQRSGGDPRRAR